jgi:hypothetical protein
MMYNVIRPFVNIDGSFLRQGDYIECDYNRAAVLRRNGLIGQVADKVLPSFPEVVRHETADEKPIKRKYRKKE